MRSPAKQWSQAPWICLALAGLSLSISMRSINRFFEGGVTQEFCHYAEIGRNILEGEGLRTRAVFPFTLAYLDSRNISYDATHAAPVLDRFPVQAYLTAVAEAFLGKTDTAVVSLSALLLVFCVLATYAAGWKLFGPTEAALAGLFLALDPSFQRGFVLWGLPDFGFLLLTFAASWMAVEDAVNPALVGITAGLAWLARSNFMIWLPFFAWAIWAPREGRARRQWLFWGGFLVASFPGWIYSLRWYGSPTPPTLSWNLAHHVVQDEYPLLNYRLVSSWDAVTQHLPELLRKFSTYLRLQIFDFPTLWQMHLLFPFSLLGIYEAFKDRGQAGRWVRLMTAMLAVHVFVFSFLRYERLGPLVGGRYLIWWAPAAFLLSARGIVSLGKRLHYPKAFPIALGALVSAWFCYYLAAPQGSAAHPSGLPVGRWPEIAAAAEAAGPNGLVVTNLPAQMAWYGQRTTVGLPAEPSDLLAIEKRHPVAAVLISTTRLGELEQAPAWQKLLRDRNALRVFFDQAGLPTALSFDGGILFRKSPGR